MLIYFRSQESSGTGQYEQADRIPSRKITPNRNSVAIATLMNEDPLHRCTVGSLHSNQPGQGHRRRKSKARSLCCSLLIIAICLAFLSDPADFIL